MIYKNLLRQNWRTYVTAFYLIIICSSFKLFNLNIFQYLSSLKDVKFVFYNYNYSIIALNSNYKHKIWQKSIIIIKKNGMKF